MIIPENIYNPPIEEINQLVTPSSAGSVTMLILSPSNRWVSLNTLTYCRKMLGGQLYTFNHFVPWKQANVIRWYICATKHKVNDYNRSLTQSSDRVSIWVDHQVLNVSCD